MTFLAGGFLEQLGGGDMVKIVAIVLGCSTGMVAIIATAGATEAERQRVAARLIELRESGQLTATDEQIDQFSKEQAAQTVSSASNRAGAGA